jgi:hypothetical protein
MAAVCAGSSIVAACAGFGVEHARIIDVSGRCPGFGRHPESLESADHLGKLAASILARRPTSRAIDSATKDCNARAQPAA